MPMKETDENTADGRQFRDERCECGNLLCKIYADTLEIKCRRCKRIHVIAIKRLVEHENL